MNKFKLGLVLRLALLIVGGIIVFLLLSFVSTNKSELEDHRFNVETANVKAAEQLRAAATANRGRLDVNLCIVSVPPQTRTPEYVKGCYDEVEKQLGIKIQRFGFGAGN